MQKTIFSDDPIVYESLLQGIVSGVDTESFVRNDTIEHAKLLVRYLLLEAEKTVKIYTSTFCHAFYQSEEVKIAFVELSKKVPDIELQIIIQFKDLTTENEQLKAISDYKELFKNIEVKFLDSSKEYPLSEYNNFLLVDNHAFRYEMDKSSEEACKQNILKDTRAMGNFNNTEFTKKFTTTFDSTFNTLP